MIFFYKFKLNIANLVRTKNEEKVDFRISTPDTSCFLSGECKNYSGKLDLKTIKKILERVPTDTKIHLVFTNKLQNSYFAKSKQNQRRGKKRKASDQSDNDHEEEDKETFQSWKIGKSSVEGLQIYKLMNNSLVTIQGLDSCNTGNRLVVFIPLALVDEESHNRV